MSVPDTGSVVGTVENGQDALKPNLHTATMPAPAATPSMRAFAQFLERCSEEGLLSRPAGLGEDDCIDGINDETALLRFFTARRFDPLKAYEHFREAFRARDVNRLCEFYARIDAELYQESTALYPHWTGRRDKRGQPLCLFDIARLSAKALSAHDTSSKSLPAEKNTPDDPSTVTTDVLRAYAVHDGLTRFVMPLCSAAPDRPDPDMPVTKQLVIADISSLGFRQAWQLKSYLENFSKLLSLNYPECLDCVLVIGAPSYISTVWGWVKRWIDPVTASKLRPVAAGEVHSTLASLIDPANIPERYGGKFQFEAGMAPVLDDKLGETLAWPPSSDKLLPTGPILWTNGSTGSRVAVATGSVNGERRRDEVATLQRSKSSDQKRMGSS